MEPADDDTALRLGGTLRFNYTWRSWDPASRARGGDLAFETLALDLDAAWKGLTLSAQYRFYAGFQAFHHGWIGWAPRDDLAFSLGLVQVPFGLLPWASHSWFFSVPYYVGFEDDHDLGLVAAWSRAGTRVHLGFFKNDEGGWLGRSSGAARLSYDPVPVAAEVEADLLGIDRATRESNTVVGRVARELPLAGGSAEVGFSLLAGQLRAGTAAGSRWAGALHLELDWRRWNVKAQAIRYAFSDPGGDDGVVVLGAFDLPYAVAERGAIWLLGVAHAVPVRWGPVEAIQPYVNASLLDKAIAGWERTALASVGTRVDATPVLAWVEWIAGRNQPFAGPATADGLAEGDGTGWHGRLNVNVGYYF